VAEVARIGLVPASSLTAADASVTAAVTMSFPDDVTLREVGLIGGAGVLVNCLRHAPLAVTAGDTLRREVRLSLAGALADALLAPTTALLAGAPGATGLNAVMLHDPTDPATPYRRALVGAERRYDAATRTVVVRCRFEWDEGPATVAAMDVLAGAGVTIATVTHTPPIVRTAPAALDEELRLELTGRTRASVPDVAGQTFATARAQLAEAGLTRGPVSEQDGTPAGTVAGQRPAPGTDLPARARVALVVGTGTLATVPDLAGRPEAEAAQRLQGAGLGLGPVTVVSSAAPAGQVLSTRPQRGSRVAPGTTVAISTASGRPVVVPDLRGRTPAAAAPVLALAGLQLAAGAPTLDPSAATAGTITAQIPAAATVVPAGLTVSVTVATGWSLPLPDLVGGDRVSAAAKLAAAGSDLLAQLGRPANPPGLQLGAITLVVSEEPTGTVLVQRPAAGTSAPLYTSVDIDMADARPLAVPSLLGSTIPEAQAALAAAGLTLTPAERRTSAAPPDTIVDQRPAAGTLVPPQVAVVAIVAATALQPVPAVLAMTLAAAHEALAGRGLAARVKHVATGSRPGTVQQQEPPAGTLAAIGSTVTLGVQGRVPALAGVPHAAAADACAAAGLVFAAGSTRQQDGPADVVVAQDPAAGSDAADGATVTCVLSAPITVAVPALGGLGLADAGRRCEASGLSLAVGSVVQAGEAAEHISVQDPAADAQVAPGSTVTVVLTRPVPPKVAVPRLIGASEELARRELGTVGLGLSVTRSVIWRLGQIPGTVVSQEPAAGSEVAPGTVVAVTVAGTPEILFTQVPGVVGDDVNTATRAVKAAGLVAQRGDTVSSSDPQGTVVSQQPAAGTSVIRGATVTLNVSSGFGRIIGVTPPFVVKRSAVITVTPPVDPHELQPVNVSLNRPVRKP
jgi:beta-lactam-binding protein with PASTA domain